MNTLQLSGFSAIITACLRALLAFYGVNIARHEQPNLILSVETQELGIPAGLQDRVIQVFEGLVYMDFRKDLMERQGYGAYESLDPRSLPPLYVAFRTDLAEGTEVFHNDIRGRFTRGEKAVLEAMTFWADLTDQVKACLEERTWDTLGGLLNQNFDKRREIYRVSEDNLRMVDLARSVGASAKFTGSGGAIVGTYPDEAAYQELEKKLQSIGVRVIKPQILAPSEMNSML